MAARKEKPLPQPAYIERESFMYETTQAKRTSNAPWPHSDDWVRVSNPATLPGSQKAPPRARSLDESVLVAEAALHAKTDRLGDTRGAWIEKMRTTVCSNPLVSVAAAIALGAVIARMTP